MKLLALLQRLKHTSGLSINPLKTEIYIDLAGIKRQLVDDIHLLVALKRANCQLVPWPSSDFGNVSDDSVKLCWTRLLFE